MRLVLFVLYVIGWSILLTTGKNDNLNISSRSAMTNGRPKRQVLSMFSFYLTADLLSYCLRRSFPRALGRFKTWGLEFQEPFLISPDLFTWETQTQIWVRGLYHDQYNVPYLGRSTDNSWIVNSPRFIMSTLRFSCSHLSPSCKVMPGPIPDPHHIDLFDGCVYRVQWREGLLLVTT